MDEKKLIQMLRDYSELQFCLRIILYYQRNIKKAVDLIRWCGGNPENILSDLPQEIRKLLEFYDFEDKIKSIDESKLIELFKQENEYLVKNMKSIFSLWKISFSQFVKLSSINYNLLTGALSALHLVDINEMKNMLYAGRNFNENALSELLYILAQINNYKEICIVNYDPGMIDVQKCLDNVEDDLLYDEDVVGLMMNRITIIQDAQLSFVYLNTYIEQNRNDKFIIIIGMERLIEFGNDEKVRVKYMDSILSLSQNENVNWRKLLEQINKLYLLIKENSSYLFTVYAIDDSMDDSMRKIEEQYGDTMAFVLLFDETHSGQSSSELHLYEDILQKAYSYLFENDFYHAALELEKLPDHADLNSEFLLAELYNMTGRSKEAYSILKEIYQKDKYMPGLVDAILYALKDSGDKEKQLSWIRKGLEINSQDITMVQHLANYYTKYKDYKASAEEWKKLYDLTGDLFYILLYEINLILCSTEKLDLRSISLWVKEMVPRYLEYADEIYSRIGSIIYDRADKEKALPYFQEVKESFKDACYNAAQKKMRIYYDRYFQKTEREINQNEMEKFISELVRHIPILTYTEQSVSSWSDYIQKSLSYTQWESLLSRMMIECLVELADQYFQTKVVGTGLHVEENSVENFGSLLEKYGDNTVLKLDKINRDEYLVLLLAHGKMKIAGGELQIANDIAYTLFRLAHDFEDDYHKSISICFGLLLWSESSMAFGAYAESMVAFIAAAKRLLEIGELFMLHDFEFVFEQFTYLYLLSARIELSPENVALLEKYFQHRQYPQVMLDYMLGRYEDIIHQIPSHLKACMEQMEEANIFIIPAEDDLNAIIVIDSFILSYDKTGESENARKYLFRWKPAIEKTLSSHIHVAYHFLRRYADILIDLRDDNFAIGLFRSLILLVEKLRQVSFSLERSYLGAPLEEIYRRMISIICKKYEGTNKNEIGSDKLLNQIISNFVPKSIIEERNGNREAMLDDMLINKEKQYYQLFSILNDIKHKTLTNEAYKRTVDEFTETKKYLEQNHPGFKPLKAYSIAGCDVENPMASLRDKLAEGELFYKNILAEDMLIHIFVDKNAYHISYERINIDQLNELLNQLKGAVNKEVCELEKLELTEYIELFEQLTNMLFHPLISKIERYHALYYMPDHMLRYVTPNFIRNDQQWGIEYFQRIELVIDYNDIGDSRKKSDSSVNKFLVSETKKGGLNKIRETVNNLPDFSELCSDENGHILIWEPLNILIIAAHGISKAFGESYYGAKRLEITKKKQVDLNDYIVLDSSVVENAIIIACSGGTPMYDKIERNNGIWDSMLRKNVNYILYCKWDVSTEHTNILLGTILREMRENGRLLSEALNIAQRELMYLHPALWAGLEVWKN